MQPSGNQFVLGVAKSAAEGFARVRVAGRGTCRETPTFELTLDALAAAGPWRRVRFDVGGCTHMDSSFAGKLAGFARRSHRLPEPPRLELLGASESLRDNLDSLLVLRFFGPEAAPEPAGLREKIVDLIPATQLERVRACREAHQELIELGGENEQRFRSVVEGLTEEEGRLEAAAKAGA
ncbi:MAG: hypothetical protein ACKVYV_19590 [Limisphaerales bacterium]